MACHVETLSRIVSKQSETIKELVENAATVASNPHRPNNTACPPVRVQPENVSNLWDTSDDDSDLDSDSASEEEFYMSESEESECSDQGFGPFV
jgi:hypothetical protein